MKIKLNQANRIDKKVQLQKQNDKVNNINIQNEIITRKNRKFGDDITKQFVKHYDFTTQDQNQGMYIPNYLKIDVYVDPQIKCYEKNIIDHIIQMHNGYQFNFSILKKKNSKYRIIREKLLDFLFKVFKKYKLKRRTLYLSCYYIDRYLQNNQEKTQENLILTAHAGMLMAMKYEEIYPPPLKQWSNQKNSKIIEQQLKMITYLDFRLVYTSPQAFLQLYHNKLKTSSEIIKLNELALDLLLYTGQIYQDHPLKIVQKISTTFRPTSYMEKNSIYEQKNEQMKILILKNLELWQKILKFNDPK